jgi:hypothetical protein
VARQAIDEASLIFLNLGARFDLERAAAIRETLDS